jgi:hypothetical protein
LTVAKNGLKLEPAETLPEYKDDEERKVAMRSKASSSLAAMMSHREPGPRRRFHLPRATTSRFAEALSVSRALRAGVM